MCAKMLSTVYTEINIFGLFYVNGYFFYFFVFLKKWILLDMTVFPFPKNKYFIFYLDLFLSVSISISYLFFLCVILIMQLDATSNCRRVISPTIEY